MILTKYKLGDILDVTRGASLSGEFYATKGEYIRLTCGNFDYQNNCFKENKSKDNLYYVGDFKPEFLMEEGDIITPLTEQAIGLLGSTAIIPESGKYIQSQDVAKIICNEDLLDKDFAFYLISSALVKQQLSAAAQQTKIRHTSPDKIKDCTVWIPELAEQKRIGKLLRSIDRKIELNRAINQNLEAMAKQLYDYWFVQFEFPNEEGKPYKSSGGAMVWNEKLHREIPRNWDVVTLSEYLNVYSEKISAINLDVNCKYAPIEVLPRRRMSFNECAPIENAVSGLCRFGKKQILLSNRRVYFHKVCIAAFDGVTRDTVIILSPVNKALLGYAYQIINDDVFIEYATRHSYGSEQPVLSWESAKIYKTLKPSNQLNVTYSKRISPIIDSVIRNELEIAKLTKQRDELLPLLMNGQVSVNSDLSVYKKKRRGKIPSLTLNQVLDIQIFHCQSIVFLSEQVLMDELQAKCLIILVVITFCTEVFVTVAWHVFLEEMSQVFQVFGLVLLEVATHNDDAPVGEVASSIAVLPEADVAVQITLTDVYTKAIGVLHHATTVSVAELLTHVEIEIKNQIFLFHK